MHNNKKRSPMRSHFDRGLWRVERSFFKQASKPRSKQFLYAIRNVRAAVCVARSRGGAHDDFHAGVRRVVGALPLFPVRVANVVQVLLVEGFHRHHLGKLGLEKTYAVFHAQASALEEKPVLLPAVVLQLEVFLQLKGIKFTY